MGAKQRSKGDKAHGRILNMKKIYLIILTSFALCKLIPAFANNPIQEILVEDIKKYNIPGVVLSVKYPEGPVMTYSAGLNNIQKNIPMRGRELFFIGSVTKSFISVLILQLQEQGKLKLSDTLNMLAISGSDLQKVLLQYPLLKNITLRQILTHTSGLPDGLNSTLFSEAFKSNPTKRWTDAELLNLAMKQKPLFKPGTKNKYYYSNTDYLLAGMVIESIMEQPLKKSLDQLFEKAKLQNIYYPPSGVAKIPDSIIKRLAQGYIDNGMTWPGMSVFRTYPSVIIPGIKPLKAYDVTSLALILDPQSPASGGIITNTESMVDWFNALFTGKVISAASLDRVLDAVPTGYGYDYGLAVTIRHSARYNSLLISHNGSQLGYQTNLLYIKRKAIIIAIAINSDSDTISDPEKGMLADIVSHIVKVDFRS